MNKTIRFDVLPQGCEVKWPKPTPINPVERKGPVKTLHGLSDYYTEHRAHIDSIILSQACAIVLGDSIAAGLSRHPEVWKSHLEPLNVINCGIGGEGVENVLWRADNLYLPDSVLVAVILVGVNNMDRNKMGDIVATIMSSAAKLREKHSHLHVVITEILPKGRQESSLRIDQNSAN